MEKFKIGDRVILCNDVKEFIQVYTIYDYCEKGYTLHFYTEKNGSKVGMVDNKHYQLEELFNVEIQSE